MRRFNCVLAACVALASLVSSTARADEAKERKVTLLESGKNLVDLPAMEFGVQALGGMSEYAQPDEKLAPNAQGIIIRDRNGMTSRMVIGMVIAIAGAMAQSGPKSQTSESHVEGNYLVTTTTTTYYSEEEKAQMRENTNKTIDGLFKAKNSEFQLDVFARDRFGYGDSSGYKVNFLVGDGKGIVFETGFGFGTVDSDVVKAGVTNHIHRDYLGMPFRVSWGMGKLRGALTWEWNWLAHGADDMNVLPVANADGTRSWEVFNHPWRFNVQGALFGRLGITAGVITPAITKPKLGFELAIAGRF